MDKILTERTEEELEEITNLLTRGVEIMLVLETLIKSKEELDRLVENCEGLSTKDFKSIVRYIYTTQADSYLEYLEGTIKVSKALNKVVKDLQKE